MLHLTFWHLENEMRNVTVNDWSDYLSDIRTYQTEYIYGDHSVMYSKLSQGEHVGMEVAEVHYCANGDRFYFIAGEWTWNYTQQSRKQKYYLRLTDIEHRFVIQCLLEYRNKLISQGKYTDGVDEVIIKCTK